jgi:hypothetical protein
MAVRVIKASRRRRGPDILAGILRKRSKKYTWASVLASVRVAVRFQLRSGWMMLRVGVGSPVMGMAVIILVPFSFV